MIIYNVTVSVNSNRVEEWIEWMKDKHIPEMMQTELFAGYEFHKLLEQDETEGLTFVIQYQLNNKEDYDLYIERHAPIMRDKTSKKFASDVIAFRTLMERL